MILIIGLGNPGKNYQNNRHNVGFLMIDYIVDQIQNSKFKIQNEKIERKSDKYFNSELLILNSQLAFVKPQIFMNNSGIAIKKLTTNYSLQPTNLIVMHDDLDIPFGKFHIQFASGPQLHNGLESIEQHLKTKDFWRIRIGVDNRLPKNNYLEDGRLQDNKMPWIEGEKYSLQNFLTEEKKLLEIEIFPKIFEQLKLDLKNQFKIVI